MPELDNARHELFAVLVAKGDGTEAECYAKAGFKSQTPAAAQANASRLIGTDKVAARIRELKAQFLETVKTALAITTTDVARHLWQLAHYSVTDVFEIRTTGKGKAARQRVMVKDTKDWPEAMKRTCQGVKVAADGSFQLMWPIRQQPATMVGKHLGMFQGESAGDVPQGVTYNDNRTTVFVDAPPRETAEEWQARVAKQRGMKVIDGKVVG